MERGVCWSEAETDRTFDWERLVRCKVALVAEVVVGILEGCMGCWYREVVAFVVVVEIVVGLTVVVVVAAVAVVVVAVAAAVDSVVVAVAVAVVVVVVVG